ncbi:MAG: type IV pilus assembly protein PilB [Candidatus Deianiraeaceae bacterium]|jgi:type IV pilus assembly protein PilB
MQSIVKPNFGNTHKAIHSLSQVEQEIVNYLLDSKAIDYQQVDIVVQEYKKKKQDLPSILVGFGFVKNAEMKKILYKKYEVEEVSLDGYVPNMDLMKMVQKNTMISGKFAPFYIKDNIIFVAASNPKESKVIDAIKIAFAHSYKIKLFYAQAEDITHFISSAYIIAENRLEKTIKSLQEDIFFTEGNRNISRIEENSVVNFVTALLEDATLKGASDIHIEPQVEFIRIRYRVDGKLLSMIHLHKRFWNAIVVRIKVISNMNIAETRQPQDGRIEMNISGRGVDYRLSCQPGIYGEKFVIRVLDKTKSLMTLSQLGFSEWNYNKMHDLIERPSGITIVTGPTGSGKTTTLYSILGYLNNPDTNIMTLEDPVEYTVPLVFQTQVRDGTAFDFASGVRSSMRQDPDILLIGEIRDHGTAEAAIRASLTGHKVLTTLHTIDAASTIQRLVDIGIDRYMISGNVDSIIAQRLVRKLCNTCKVPHAKPTEYEKTVLHRYSYLVAGKYTMYEAVGCEDCRFTGYRGRTTIAEIIQITPLIDNAILEGRTKHAIVELARQEGFMTLQEDSMRCVFDGIVSFKEVNGVVSL